jgi:branched-chain amino acid transport system ATP-binding protein
VVGLVGANGAGKSTLLNLLTGAIRPDGGEVYVCGRPMNGQSPAAFAHAGVARTFQKLRLFLSLTVLENICAAMPSPGRWSLRSALLRDRAEVGREDEERAKGLALLRLVGLEDRAHHTVIGLTYGQRRLVELARALARDATVVLLDEPAAGMSEGEERQLCDVLIRINQSQHLAFLIVEHRWALLRRLAHRALWLSEGRIVQQGAPESVFAAILDSAGAVAR